MMPELHHLFVVTAGTEPATTTTKGQEIFRLTIWAFNTCEALVQIAAFEIFIDNLRYNLTIEAILLLEKLIITLFKLG
jgi:hypothetical protein